MAMEMDTVMVMDTVTDMAMKRRKNGRLELRRAK